MNVHLQVSEIVYIHIWDNSGILHQVYHPLQIQCIENSSGIGLHKHWHQCLGLFQCHCHNSPSEAIHGTILYRVAYLKEIACAVLENAQTPAHG